MLTDEELLAVEDADVDVLSNEEVARLDQLLTKTPTPSAPPQSSLLESTAQGVKEGLKKTLVQTATSPLPLPVQGVMNLGAPFLKAADDVSRRGTRGIGVGTQRLIEGDNPEQALNRAAEAVKPEYKPVAGEKIGSFTGEHINEIIPAVAGAAALAKPALKTVFAPTKGTIDKLYRVAESEIGLPERASDINKLKEVFGIKKGSLNTVANKILDTPVDELTKEQALRYRDAFKNYQGKVEGFAQKPSAIKNSSDFVQLSKAEAKANAKLAKESPTFVKAQEASKYAIRRRKLVKGASALTGVGALKKAFDFFRQ